MPIGGMHDGGADGALSNELLEDQRKTGFYFQASIVSDVRKKIRDTIASLKKSRGEIRHLTYYSSHLIPMVDRLENDLSAEMDTPISIRDRQWISTRINENNGTKQAFLDFLSPVISYLDNIGQANTLPKTGDSNIRALQVFLGQETDRRRSRSDLLLSVTDTLIIWALDGTDPDRGIFRTRDQILSRVETILPSAKQFIRGQIDGRLELLCKKSNSSGRTINHHKTKGYCLPFETRKLIRQENEEDEVLKLEVTNVLVNRARNHADKLGLTEEINDLEAVAEIALTTIAKTFEHRGLELATFLENGGKSEIEEPIDEILREVVRTTTADPERSGPTIRVAASIIRSAFYEGSEVERLYFGKLSRTYSLLFFLRAEPRVVEYFQSMSAHFHLFVGADILVRALSETYLNPQNQMTVNLLKILTSAGATLILAKPVVDEVYTNLRNSDLEFKNYVMEIEPYITPEFAAQVPKIMVRAYLYAKLNVSGTDKKPAGWRSFVNQFCTYEALYRTEAWEEIRDLLIAKFKMQFMSDDDLMKMIDADELEGLTNKIVIGKRKDSLDEDKAMLLAKNDATMILAVYEQRSEKKETLARGPYGFRTWWLTQESYLQRYTAELVVKRGSRYILRPDFVLNFISLAPSMEEVRQAYEGIFPTLLGIRLSNRVGEPVFHDMVTRTKEAYENDPDRGSVIVAKLSDRLKADHIKEYENRLFDDL